MSRKKFIEVASHELAHDWMQEYYPKISDLKVKEGWAQYIAWRVNKIYGNLDFNTLIEKNKDPIYGDGFRLINEKAGESDSWLENIKKYFGELNKK